jgi:hypothetical protein
LRQGQAATVSLVRKLRRQNSQLSALPMRWDCFCCGSVSRVRAPPADDYFVVMSEQGIDETNHLPE